MTVLLGSVNRWMGFDLLEGFDVSFICQSKTGALEGPEVDGFVKDMMELVKVSARFFSFY